MKKLMKRVLLLCAVLASCLWAQAGVREVRQINLTTVEVIGDDGVATTIDFYGANILRLFQDPNGGIIRNPEATPPAQILVDEPRRCPGALTLNETADAYIVETDAMRVSISKQCGCLSITDKRTGRVVLRQVVPIEYNDKGAWITFAEQADEYFYGGGVQNGRFSHKGNIIQIVNTNNWTDGGVASPTPFYWSTGGYSVMWHTFAPGRYDFGATQQGRVVLTHETNYVDLFISVSETPVALLNDFYQLTGRPVLLPKFGFYEGHLNAYNRDYWLETPNGATDAMGMVGAGGSVLFEDGRYYRESQTDNGGIRESLNGENDNYQFSARAVIDRYRRADMPLGWILVNDGYGAGYGQTGTLEGNVENLRQFGEYARANGVEMGLWTQSDLHPREGVEALLQRDIVREVRDAGVRVLKTDVAWVGAGYSFGLNGVADVGEIMPYYGNNARPFIISLDGWAGTQRYAGIWTGDQTGGEWEYIRFHIPTYIGSGLSGQPNICSDMDGIFGGRNVGVNVRDFQWKTFSPIQLNMDGWGSNPKYPQALGGEATGINRWYLKLKSILMPYTYSIAREAVDGMPMIRAMMLEYPNAYTYGNATRYQYMYGPNILVAPIYRESGGVANEVVRDGIYLPEGEWLYMPNFDVYQGGVIVNNLSCELSQFPWFIKVGSITPMTLPHNNPNDSVSETVRNYLVVPGPRSTFNEYNDDGRTQAYLYGRCTNMLIEQELSSRGQLTITLHRAEGEYDGQVKRRSIGFTILSSTAPTKVVAKVNGRKQRVTQGRDMQGDGIRYFYEDGFCIVYAPSSYTTDDELELTIDGVALNNTHPLHRTGGALEAPRMVVEDNDVTAYTVTPRWMPVTNANYYEVEFEGMTYSTIVNNYLLFEDLTPVTEYEFKVRAVNADGHSEWTTYSAVTKPDPLRLAIRGIRAETTCQNQGGQGIDKLFDFDESKNWHTDWSNNPPAVPFDIIVDLRTVNVLSHLHYMPRGDAGNGTLLHGTIAWSMDKTNWHDESEFTWARNGETKVFSFAGNPTARYIKVHVDEAVGNFGSGQEMYIFRVDGSEYYIPGDVNHDGRIDENDLTSYMNYTGLRAVDPDYQGYMSQGDLDNNGMIDAYDISAVAIELESGVSSRRVPTIEGEITVTADKRTVRAGDEVRLTVMGVGMVSVNAIGMCIPYDATKWEYVGIEANTLEMRNLTYDRLHADGQKALYPTYINCGEHPYLEGDATVMTITFRAKTTGQVDLEAKDVIIVDKYLNKQQSTD